MDEFKEVRQALQLSEDITNDEQQADQTWQDLETFLNNNNHLTNQQTIDILNPDSTDQTQDDSTMKHVELPSNMPTPKTDIDETTTTYETRPRQNPNTEQPHSQPRPTLGDPIQTMVFSKLTSQFEDNLGYIHETMKWETHMASQNFFHFNDDEFLMMCQNSDMTNIWNVTEIENELNDINFGPNNCKLGIISLFQAIYNTTKLPTSITFYGIINTGVKPPNKPTIEVPNLASRHFHTLRQILHIETIKLQQALQILHNMGKTHPKGAYVIPYAIRYRIDKITNVSQQVWITYLELCEHGFEPEPQNEVPAHPNATTTCLESQSEQTQHRNRKPVRGVQRGQYGNHIYKYNHAKRRRSYARSIYSKPPMNSDHSANPAYTNTKENTHQQHLGTNSPTEEAATNIVHNNNTAKS